MNEVAVGIDIGSSKVCTIIGELDKKNQLQVLGVGECECNGLKKGIIVDIDNTAGAIKNSIEQAERMSDLAVKSAYINISGGHATLIKNRGVIAVSRDDREITLDDVDRVLQTVRIVNIPIDREVIGVVPIQFIVDGYEHIKDPVGMLGVRLEVEAYVITAVSASVQNLIKSVERSGLDVSGIVLNPIASAEILLSKDERELGVALVDVGGEVTDISVFKGGDLVYTSLIPVGGMHITSDISIGLKIPMSEAEMLKRQYGYAALSMIKSVENISISGAGAGNTRTIVNKELIDIIEARVSEIYYLINNELKSSAYKDSIPGGIVITGGGLSFIKGTLEVASSIIGLPMRIGAPSYIGVASPVYTAGTGVVKYILSSKKSNAVKNRHSDSDDISDSVTKLKKQTSQEGQKFINRVKEFFTDFF